MCKIHVTLHDSEHKLAGMQSISTSVKSNPVCQARIKKALEENDFECVCLHCFAENQLNYKISLKEHLENNVKALTERLLTDEEIEEINLYTAFVRIESFGDTRNVIQAMNYLKIIESNPDLHFGVWTKNLAHYVKAFEKMGKPSNMTLVFSSSHLNAKESIPKKWMKWIDHRYTVYDNGAYEEAVEEGSAPCNGISCKACGHKCYKMGTFDIAEKVRGKKSEKALTNRKNRI